MSQYQVLKEYLNQTKAQRYPFTGHYLSGKEDFVKNTWLKTLCTLLLAESSISEEQTIFLQRLIAGAEAEYDVETYMRQGADVTGEQLEEFFSMMLDGTEQERNQKRYSFVLDALILLHLGQPDDDAEELTALLCEALRFTPEELEWLAGIAAGVLQMNPALCLRHCVEPSWELESLDLWKIYFVGFTKAATSIEDSRLIQAAVERAPMDISCVDLRMFTMQNLKARNPDKPYMPYSTYDLDLGASGVSFNNVPGMFLEKKSFVCLYNLDIYLNRHLCFSDNRQILLVNCRIHGNLGESVWFLNCQDVTIRGCTFEHMNQGRMIYSIGNNRIQILDSEFLGEDIYYKAGSYSWKELSGVIYSDSQDMRLTLIHSTFLNCVWKNSEWSYRSAIISNCPSVITDCRFENCWHYNNSKNKDPDSGYGNYPYLFTHVLSESGNEVTNSAKLGPG